MARYPRGVDNPMFALPQKHIRETHDRLAQETGKAQPLIKSASFITVREAMILIGCMEDLCFTFHLSEYRERGERQACIRSKLDKPSLKWAN
ncbi:hypothetical protein L204_101815 [Cryptococcus depauperatus]